MGDRGEVISVELDPERAAEVAAQAQRLGLRSVTVLEADAAAADARPRASTGCCVDAPCSDLGTLASRPDARWRKSPRAIERLAELQDADPARGPPAPLRPGGTLVYSTCTISRRENEDRVAALLAAAAGEVPPLALDDLGARAPGLASPPTPAACSSAPTATAPPDSSSPGLRRDD